MSISIPNIVRITQSTAENDITISVLQKQMVAILKFFFPFGLWPHHRNPHEILHKIGNVNNQFTYCSVEGAGVIDASEVAVVIVNNFVNNIASIVF